MAKNIDVLEAFVNGEEKPKTKNLYITGKRLYNYSTCLAERTLNESGEYEFVINTTKYSSSTSTIQNQLKRLLIGENVKEVSDIRMNASCL